MKKLDLTGKRFGILTVIGFAGNVGKKQDRAWLCKCDCGKEKIISGGNLTGGRSKSCGCVRKEKLSNSKKVHGYSNTRLYKVYKGMKSRCNNPNNPAYKYYGEKKIKICTEWENDFVSFRSWSYKNGYSEDSTGIKCSIDRIDPNKGYSPDNCRWVSMKVQANNTTQNTFINIGDLRMTAAEWADNFDVKKQTLYTALYRALFYLHVDPNDIAEISIVLK